MSRPINGALIKRLRAERHWSQEELAIAAGLSSRTIQRLETESKGSVQSIKSIASALEVDMHNIEEKPRTQLVGVRYGYGGAIVGGTISSIAILTNLLSGRMSSLEAGIYFGLLGAFLGLTFALIGWMSNRS